MGVFDAILATYFDNQLIAIIWDYGFTALDNSKNVLN
jgi:hypothetical protein